jgi:hypothetical protein
MRGLITITVLSLLLFFELGMNGAVELKAVATYASLR